MQKEKVEWVLISLPSGPESRYVSSWWWRPSLEGELAKGLASHIVTKAVSQTAGSNGKRVFSFPRDGPAFSSLYFELQLKEELS